VSLDVVLITNSPGELSSWVRITVEKVRAQAAVARIIVMLVPCPYASGREAEVARTLEGVSLVLTPTEFLTHLAGIGPTRYAPADRGVVVFLGGDYWHALMMARKLVFPAVAYTDRASSWGKYFWRLCVPDPALSERIVRLGVPAEKVVVVGNLMVEGVRPSMQRAEALASWGLDPQRLLVGLFPGSRYYHAQASLTVFLRVAEELVAERADVQFAIARSPFLSRADLETCLQKGSPPYLVGSGGQLRAVEGGAVQVVTERGVVIPVVEGQPHDLMQHSDMLLTIPGTNTAEMACLGRPMVVALSWRAQVPRGGPGALLGKLPLASGLRRSTLRGLLRRLRFTALPNMRARREIVPEVRVENDPSEITRVAADLLFDPQRRAAMTRELTELMGQRGASERIADIVLEAASLWR
jgi:hypothetical protein